MSDRRKRIRCKICHQRINVIYEVDWNRRIIKFSCPKCFGNGELKLTKKI